MLDLPDPYLIRPRGKCDLRKSPLKSDRRDLQICSEGYIFQRRPRCETLEQKRVILSEEMEMEPYCHNMKHSSAELITPHEQGKKNQRSLEKFLR